MVQESTFLHPLAKGFKRKPDDELSKLRLKAYKELAKQHVNRNKKSRLILVEVKYKIKKNKNNDQSDTSYIEHFINVRGKGIFDNLTALHDDKVYDIQVLSVQDITQKYTYKEIIDELISHINYISVSSNKERNKEYITKQNEDVRRILFHLTSRDEIIKEDEYNKIINELDTDKNDKRRIHLDCRRRTIQELLVFRNTQFVDKEDNEV